MSATRPINYPTIGRRVWYWPTEHDLTRSGAGGGDYEPMTQIYPDQAFDAGVVAVHASPRVDDGMSCYVNLDVTDQAARHRARETVLLVQDDDIRAGLPGFAQWMPYQGGKAREASVPKGDGNFGTTKVYSDGTTATGAGQLPDQSPAQQASSGIGGAITKGRDFLKTIAMGAMEAQAVSAAISNVSKGPRVTMEQINDEIAGEYYTTADRAFRESPVMTGMELLTICVLVMRNGYTVLGKSACAAPENFDAAIGQRIAREDAVRQCWALLGYELKTELSNY